MRILYIDNLRGFNNTFIPLKDVNFLVGENSTGKTSILYLLYLLSSPSFWFIRTEFNTLDFRLGSFREIVNMQSKNKKNFRIGLLEYPDKPKSKEESKIFICLFRFRQIDGAPSIDQYSYFAYNHEIRTKISSTGRISFKSNLIDTYSNYPDPLWKVFNEWIDTTKDYRNFKFIKEETHFKRDESIYYIAKIIDGKILSLKERKGKTRSITPSFFGRCFWIGPIRSKPQKTYDEYTLRATPEGAHIPYIIEKLLNKRKKPFTSFLEHYGKRSALFDLISIEKLGKYTSSPFELKIKLHKNLLNICQVGYGVSQCLPILVESFGGFKNSWFTIQQPEIHLHPRAQAILGELIYNLCKSDNKKFLIETHSDFIIDRFRLELRKHKKKIDSQVLFFERSPKGNKVHSIPIKTNGEYPKLQPRSFRNFFVHEALKMLSL